MQIRNETKTTPGGFSVPDAANYIGVSESTTWRLIRDGTLRAMKLRGRTVVPRAACDALLAKTA